MSDVQSKALLEAVKAGNQDEVQRLLQRTASDTAPPTPQQVALASAADADGSTALHWCAWVRQASLFSLLVSSGAPVVARNSRGESVLEWAIRGAGVGGSASSTILSTILLAEGLDVHATNAFGGTAAHIAAEEGAEAVLIALLLLGAPIDAPDSRSKTPLMCAAHRNRPGAMQWLLRHGADVTKTDSEGASALHYAAIGGNELNCTELIKLGMAPQLDVRAFPEKLTPAELADKYGQVACAGALRRWKVRTSSLMNRLFFRYGLDRPRTSRPFLTSPQIYFDIGIVLTLAHFQTVLAPQFTDPQISDLAQDASYHWLTFIMWSQAVLAIIGMNGFMLMEPGFIPKGPQLSGRAAQAKDGLVAKALSGMTVCAPCRIVKVIRSKHCQMCGGCVARMDHHCPWVNSCVGVNNHRSFFGVIISMLLAASCHAYLAFFYAFSFAPSLPPIDGALGAQRSIWDEKLVLFLMLHSTTIVLGCLALLLGQSYTVSIALTTNEAFNRWRYAYLAQNGGHSPFSEGLLRNWLTFCGLRKGKSFVRSATSSFTLGPRASDAGDVILELEGRSSAGQHGHSHGGQPCHGHGEVATNTGASPTPQGSLNLQALMHPPHHHAHHAGDADPDCAYFHGAESNSLAGSVDVHGRGDDPSSESTGLISGLLSSKDKDH